MKNESLHGYIKFLCIIIAFVFILIFRRYVIERVIVNGESMQPNFYQDDICWADKRYKDLKRYDVVVAEADKKDLIKRVIGVPGDQIRIEDGTVYINDEKIVPEYDFTTYPTGSSDYEIIEENSEKILTLNGEKVTDKAEYICGENEYFLLGDNRQASGDSRRFGLFNRKNIKGKIIMRFFPFDKIEVY